jgi:hypothetical protein
MNLVGLVAALATFFSIWFGHVAVRKIESISHSIWLPTTIFVLLAAMLEWLSLSTSNLQLSAVSGIAGITLLWDALELTRQQNRVKKGHSPANPNNPRHARIMQEYASATKLDLLKRKPVGKPVSPVEAVKLIIEH